MHAVIRARSKTKIVILGIMAAAVSERERIFMTFAPASD